MRLEYFQMVDRIAVLDPEARIVRADCVVPDTSPVFEGHFPGHPLLPGVLMIETMTQLASLLILDGAEPASMHLRSRAPFEPHAGLMSTCRFLPNESLITPSPVRSEMVRRRRSSVTATSFTLSPPPLI